MHYYKKNIGDYHTKAGRLTMLEHGAYTLLIDACYDRERFPTLDEALEWTWARNEAEIEAVKFVLGRFFELRDGTYVQKRIAEEISKYHENAATNTRIAIEREKKRREREENSAECDGVDTNRSRTLYEPPRKKHEMPPNQEPLTNNKKRKTNVFLRPTRDELVAEFAGRILDPEYESEKFFNHYESNGWHVGKSPMKSWPHAVTNWINRRSEDASHGKSHGNHYPTHGERLAAALDEAFGSDVGVGVVLEGNFQHAGESQTLAE
jgi:uncharacterized protein YdaU (DUF1376 family)